MKMQTVPTVTVLTAVLVSKGSLAMARFVTMSTNVLQKQVLVMKTLIVLTVMVFTAVHANRDLLEMELFVKILMSVLQY